MKDATIDPEYGKEAVAPLTRIQLDTLQSLWAATRAELEQRKWTWQSASGADSECFAAEFGYDIADGRISLFAAESEEREDDCRRGYIHWTGEAISASFPLRLLALSERSFDRWCARIRRERLKAEARRIEAAAQAAAKTAAEKAAKEAAAAERAERTQFTLLLAKYGQTDESRS